MINLENLNLDKAFTDTDADIVAATSTEVSQESFQAANIRRPTLSRYTAGVESLNWDGTMPTKTTASTLGQGGGASQSQRAPIHIRTSDGQNFRIYINSYASITPLIINVLCRFLDTRSPNQNVYLILGSGLNDIQSHMLGAIISSISSCQAKVTAVAAGWCTIGETMMWCFAKSRRVLQYGALTFGANHELVKAVEQYKTYFDLFLNKGKDLGLLTDEDINSIWENHQTKFLMYGDFDLNEI